MLWHLLLLARFEAEILSSSISKLEMASSIATGPSSCVSTSASGISSSRSLLMSATRVRAWKAMARCGLCAFELQLLPEAHSALMELAGGSRLKEMLAQGISNSHSRDRAAEKEQEKAERRRLVPYHMWINLDLVEAVHLVTAMLLELPNLAHNAYDPKRRSAPVSRTFRRYLDQHERQVFTGPPEGTRDYVMRTSKLLLDGEWKRAADLV